MNKDTHKKVHRRLHFSFDELVTDYIAHTKLLLGQSTILDLMIWSYEQTENPAGLHDDDEEE